MEAAGLGIFMISASLFGTILEYPGTPIHETLSDPFVRRMVMGVLMGLTAISIIYSPWGQQSGAHINPSVTLAFYRLGKISGWDAIFYVLAQCLGGLAGMILATIVLIPYISAPSVNYVVTVPGSTGPTIAFVAEISISAVLIIMVLTISNSKMMSKYTGVVAGILVAIFITWEAPFSGMSMNPARSLASAVPAWVWSSFWIYLSAPVLGMLLGAESYLLLAGRSRIKCAKLNHENQKRCIFRCSYQELQEAPNR